MAQFMIKRSELESYSKIADDLSRVNEDICVAKLELAELNKCLMNIGPVLTGMPSGNEKRDRIADFVIKLEQDRARFEAELVDLNREMAMYERQIWEIKNEINKIPNEQARKIITWHFIDLHSIAKVVRLAHVSEATIYRRISEYVSSEETSGQNGGYAHAESEEESQPQEIP